MNNYQKAVSALNICTHDRSKKKIGGICVDHMVVIKKKNPNISDCNEALKKEGYQFFTVGADVVGICEYFRKLAGNLGISGC